MGHWFGRFRDDMPWRKTPARIKGVWYTPRGDKIDNPDAYFATVARRGRFWDGDTGWPGSSGTKKRSKNARRWNG
ncbi:hypothetical protein ACTVJH_12270 [Desulfoplanes sp. PS50]|jgi:hypothetical protein